MTRTLLRLSQKWLIFVYKLLIFIIGDLNMTTENRYLNCLLQIYDLTVLIKKPTCYQSPNPNYTGHFLTNRKALFKHCQTFETVLSDHYKKISTIMKKKKKYRSYKKFNHECFSDALKEALETLESDTYGEFEK